jgi:hypothetical protein
MDEVQQMEKDAVGGMEAAPPVTRRPQAERKRECGGGIDSHLVKRAHVYKSWGQNSPYESTNTSIHLTVGHTTPKT